VKKVFTFGERENQEIGVDVRRRGREKANRLANRRPGHRSIIV
jgi:hypothetical protein